MRAVVTLPVVAWAILTGVLLFRNSEHAMSLLTKGCPDNVAFPWRSNIPALDKILCLLVNFFVRAQSSDEGQFVTGYICSLVVSVLAFMAVEGSRIKSAMFLSTTWIHSSVAQLTGVSVSFPLLWLTTYFLTDGANRDPHQIWKKKISLPRVAAIGFTFLFLWLNSIALFFPLRTDQKQMACLLFLVMPAAVTLAYLPFNSGPDAQQQKGHKGVIALHLLQAGFGLTWHLVAILYVIRDPELPGRILQLLTSFRPDEYAVYFLLIDFLSLFLSFVYLTALEDGILIALLEVVGACVFGPAFAVSAYCVFREQSISKAVSGGRGKRKD